jgi:hypothetical protein
MSHLFKLAAVAALCATTFAAQANVAFDANLELDTTFTNTVKAPATNARDRDLGLGGRLEVNAAAKASNGQNFVAGRGSVLLKKDGETAVDDFWVQIGNASGDIKLGRFEGVDLFPVGKDTVLEYAGYTPYQGNKLRGRKGTDEFHGALGVNAAPGLRFEMGLVFSKESGKERGLRPAVVYTSGPLTLRGGLESVELVGSTAKSETGLALSGGYQVGKDIYVNANFAKLEKDKTFGLNATMGSAGLGLVYGKGVGSANKVTTVYAAYTLPLLGVKGASMTPALSYSKGGSGTDNQLAARLRINYAF